MGKGRLIVLVFVPLFVALWPAAATQGQDAPFTVQSIVIEQRAYDMKVSPDGRIAAIYLGQTAGVLLGIPAMEYKVDPTLLPIRLVDLSSGNELGELTGQTDYVADVAFTRDGKQLASYHRNGDILLWDTASRRLVKRLSAVMGSAKLKFLADGKTLIVYQTGGIVGYFLVFDVETGSITKIWHAPARSFGDLALSKAPNNLDYQYIAFDISPDGKLLATATPNGELALWDTASLQQTVVQKKSQKPGAFNIRSVMFSADGKTLVFFDSTAKQTHFWDVASRAEKSTVAIGEQFFALSPRNDVLAWASRKELWFAPVDKPDAAVKVMDFPDNLLVAAPQLTFTPDGSRIVVGGFGTKDGGDNVLYVIALK